MTRTIAKVRPSAQQANHYIRHHAYISWFAICVLAFVVVWSVLFLPQYLVNARHMPLSPTDRLNAESAIRSSLLQLLGGAILIGGLYFTARGFRLTRQGHLTDRYARSIEQIGHNSLDVRIGGIFALEKIAQDSLADRQTVVETLAAFVREHTRTGPREPRMDEVSADVQAALTVLGRRPNVEDERQHLDLYFCGLNDADLANADLRNAMLYYSNLTDTSFANANLDGAGLSFCRSERPKFTGASARNANFVNAEYKYGWFLHADLTNADFYGCDLTGTDFGRRYAEEGNPPFPPAILASARMTKAILHNTNLRGVDLSTVRGLRQDQLEEAITDDNTILPSRWGGGEDEYT